MDDRHWSRPKKNKLSSVCFLFPLPSCTYLMFPHYYKPSLQTIGDNHQAGSRMLYSYLSSPSSLTQAPRSRAILVLANCPMALQEKCSGHYYFLLLQTMISVQLGYMRPRFLFFFPGYGRMVRMVCIFQNSIMIQ